MQIDFEDIILKPWILYNAQELALIANNKHIADNLRDGFPNPYFYDDAINWLRGTIMINAPPVFLPFIMKRNFQEVLDWF